MRLKLTENLNHNPHSDAARQRDVANKPDNVVPPKEAVKLVVNTVNSDEQVFSDEELLSPNEDEEEDEKEKVADSRLMFVYNLGKNSYNQ